MQVRLHKTCDELPDATLARWRQLARDHLQLEHPLLSPTWAKLNAATQDGIEVAAASFDDGSAAFLPFRRMGSQGYPIGGSLSDLHGLIAPPNLWLDLAELLRECRLTALHYDHLPAEQSWFAPHTARIDDAAIVVLQEGFETYWRQRREASPSWTKQFERKSRKLAREVGPLRFTWHDPDPDCLDALIDWKRRQLGPHFADIFALTWLRPLIERLIASKTEECQGVLSTLRAGEQLVAVHLGIRNPHTLVSSIPTHSEEFQAHSPGAILHVELAKAAAERGIQSIDLGRGINPLKQSLGSTTRKLAIGVVDLQPARRWCRNYWFKLWFKLRDLVHASPLALRAYREVRRSI